MTPKNQKYCYVIADKENGKLLLRTVELPFFWKRSVAKEICKNFNGYIVQKIWLDDIEKLVLSSMPLNTK